MNHFIFICISLVFCANEFNSLQASLILNITSTCESLTKTQCKSAVQQIIQSTNGPYLSISYSNSTVQVMSPKTFARYIEILSVNVEDLGFNSTERVCTWHWIRKCKMTGDSLIWGTGEQVAKVWNSSNNTLVLKTTVRIQDVDNIKTIKDVTELPLP